MMLTHYSEFEIETGRVLRHGTCDSGHIPEPKAGRAIALIPSQPGRQRIEYDFLDAANRAINPRVIDLTAQEIEARRPKPIPDDDLPASITRGQWQALLARVKALEAKTQGGGN